MSINASIAKTIMMGKNELEQIFFFATVPTFLAGFIGNVLVIRIVHKKRTMHTKTNYLLVNLALSDIITIFMAPLLFLPSKWVSKWRIWKDLLQDYTSNWNLHCCFIIYSNGTSSRKIPRFGEAVQDRMAAKWWEYHKGCRVYLDHWYSFLFAILRFSGMEPVALHMRGPMELTHESNC